MDWILTKEREDDHEQKSTPDTGNMMMEVVDMDQSNAYDGGEAEKLGLETDD